MRWVNRTSGIKRYQLQLAARQRQPGNKWTSVWTRLQRIHISRSIPQGQRREKVKVSGKSEKSRVGEIKKYFHFPAADYLYSPWLHFTPLIFVSIAAVPPLQHRCCYSNSFGLLLCGFLSQWEDKLHFKRGWKRRSTLPARVVHRWEEFLILSTPSNIHIYAVNLGEHFYIRERCQNSLSGGYT